MTQTRQQDFIDTILFNLEKNGYPEKKVALPLETLYEKAHAAGLNFNKIRETIESQGITITSSNERLIFSKKIEPIADVLKDFDQDEFANMPPSERAAKAQEAIKNMSPEQMKSMQAMFENMTEEQRENIMKQGKNLGFF